MSKMWKFVIGLVIVGVVVVVVGLGWFIAGRNWTPRAFSQRPGVARQLEVRLIDDNKDGVPDRGMVDLPAGTAFERNFERGKRAGAEAGQLTVRLLDDNGDGIPDRGVLDHPTLNSSFGPLASRPFNQRFEPERGRPFGLLITPFFLIGGLIRGLLGLALLALMFSLTIFLYRRWQPTRPVAVPVDAPPAPADAPSTPANIQLDNDSSNAG